MDNESRLEKIDLRLSEHDTWISRAIGGIAVAVVFLGFFAYTYTDLKSLVNNKIDKEMAMTRFTELSNHLDRIDRHLESIDDKILELFRRMNTSPYPEEHRHE